MNQLRIVQTPFLGNIFMAWQLSFLLVNCYKFVLELYWEFVTGLTLARYNSLWS